MSNNDDFKGKMENLKGRAKEAAGAVTGNKGLEAEGAAERIKGAAQEAAANARKKIVGEDDADDDVE
jgi:uncharacterized protein YjbJ (UPF0337 family)